MVSLFSRQDNWLPEFASWQLESWSCLRSCRFCNWRCLASLSSFLAASISTSNSCALPVLFDHFLLCFALRASARASFWKKMRHYVICCEFCTCWKHRYFPKWVHSTLTIFLWHVCWSDHTPNKGAPLSAALSMHDERYLHITSASTSTSIQDRLPLRGALAAAAGTAQQHCGRPLHISAAHLLPAQIRRAACYCGGRAGERLRPALAGAKKGRPKAWLEEATARLRRRCRPMPPDPLRRRRTRRPAPPLAAASPWRAPWRSP